MCLSDDRAKAPAAKMSAHLRNEAEGTRAVAAFGNLDEGIVTRRSEHARGRLVVEISRALIAEWEHRQRPRVRPGIANAQDVVDLASADKGINFRHFGFQLIAITFNQTTGNYQARGFAIGLQTRGFKNSFNRFLLRRINKATRIHDHRVRLSSVASDLVTI